MPRAALSSLLVVLALILPGRLSAQATRSDSAAALLRAARLVEARGDHRLAHELFRYLSERFAGTESAQLALETLRTAPDGTFEGITRTGFFLYHTMFGAWLGVVVPLAFDADGSEPYGAGLLIGAPLGFFGSRAISSSRNLSEGQAGIIEFGSFWGTWQAMGWQSVFDIGDREEVLGDGGSFSVDSETAPWIAAILGGISGLAAGYLASAKPVRAGTSSLVFNGSMWGTGYGFAAGLLADAEGDDLLAAGLIGGNLGLLASIPLASTLRPEAPRVRTVSAAGLAGALAGVGVVLLTDVSSKEGVSGMVTGGATLGLVTGILLTKDRYGDGLEVGAGPALSGSVLSKREGWSLGFPLPMPALLPAPSGSRHLVAPGARLTLADIWF